MDTPNQKIIDLLELINLYPSPHNGQPIRLKQTGTNTFDIYFQKERGLQAVDISFIFSFVTMGVFMQYVEYCAQALGNKLTYELSLPQEAELKGSGTIKFATVTLHWDSAEPDPALSRSLRFRQTSRKKYHSGISPELAQLASQTATAAKMSLKQLNKKQSQQAIWLNQRAVFDDMFDEPVRQELNHWLRYSKTQKEATKDGLAYDCMELNGRLMKYIVDHPKLLRAPGISWITKQYYLRTMKDSSDVLYMLAPFASGQDSFNVGKVIMQIWQEVSAQGYYLHPFGTIMSNHAAHRDFLNLAGISNESRDVSYLVFIFRCGKSEVPTTSLRIPYSEHLIME